MAKPKINQPNGFNPKTGVYSMDRRWRASRLDGNVKNKGIMNIKKPKKTNW